MKKSLFNTLIVAGSLIVVGIIILLGCFLTGTFTVGGRSASDTYVKKTLDLEAAGYRSMSFGETSKDFVFSPSEDEMIHIEYYDRGNDYRIVTEDSKLIFHYSSSDSFIGINVRPTNYVTTVKLPSQVMSDILVDTASGNVSVADLNITGNANIDTASGEVILSNTTITGKLKANTASGDVTLTSVTAKTIDADTTSGEVKASDSKADEFYINTTSGDVTMLGAKLGAVEIDTVSGEVSFKSLECTDIDIDTTSGDINGSIKGNARDYSVDFDTVSGDSNIGKYSGGKYKLEIDTTSGDCFIVFEE